MALKGLWLSGKVRNVITNTGWLLFDRIYRMLVGFFVAVWIARYLGPEQYGFLTFAQSFVALFAVFATLGLEAIVVRNIVKEPLRKHEILGTSLLLKFIGSVLTFGLTLLIISFMRPDEDEIIRLVAIVSFGNIFLIFDSIGYWFQAQVASKYRVYANAIAFTLASGIKVALIVMDAPLIAFAYAGVVEYGLASLGLIMAYRQNSQSMLKWRATWNCTKELLNDSWPLILSGLSIMIYMRVDQIMLAEMVGERELGIYSVAVRLGEMWYFVPLAIVSSTFPAIIRAKEVSHTLFSTYLQRLYDLMAIIGYAVAIATTILSTQIVKLFGSEYSGAAPVLTLYIWIGVFVNLGIARGSFLNTMNYKWLNFLTSFTGAWINVVLNLILIPKYGAYGATLASLVAYWFQTHGSCFFFSPLRETGKMLTRAMLAPIRLPEIIRDILQFKENQEKEQIKMLP